mgnify:CR=1 FL=1
MSVFKIAEIAQAHNGSLEKVFEYIDAIALTGVDAIKFQTHIAHAESSIHEPFRVKFSDQDATRYDYWKRMEFSLKQWHQIKARCDDKGLEFMSSPFSNAAVDLLEQIGVERYKIGSGEVTNFLLLEKIVQTKKPIILSSGMSSIQELDQAVAFLQERNAHCSILQCTTSYPTPPERYGLNVIKELQQRYQVPIGYSDHSARIGTCIAAVALGAQIIEFHAVFSRSDFGPDAKSSLEMEEIKTLVKEVDIIALSRKHKVDKTTNTQYTELKRIFEKSLAVNKAIAPGHKLTFEDLEAKKPKGYGIDASQYQSVIGREVRHPLDPWDFLTETDLK